MTKVYLESDGKSVNVTPSADVEGKVLATVEGFVGITGAELKSGELGALIIDQREYQFPIPATLDVAKGDTVYVTVASAVDHVFPDAAYSKTSGAGKKAAFRATSAHYTGADGQRMCDGILLPDGV